MTISLRNLINEATCGPENRVSLNRIVTIMEKHSDDFTKAQSTKINELFKVLSECAEELNTTPYIRTDNNFDNWGVLVASLTEKVTALKKEVEKIANKKKDVDFRPLLKALDEVLIF